MLEEVMVKFLMMTVKFSNGGRNIIQYLFLMYHSVNKYKEESNLELSKVQRKSCMIRTNRYRIIKPQALMNPTRNAVIRRWIGHTMAIAFLSDSLGTEIYTWSLANEGCFTTVWKGWSNYCGKGKSLSSVCQANHTTKSLRNDAYHSWNLHPGWAVWLPRGQEY